MRTKKLKKSEIYTISSDPRVYVVAAPMPKENAVRVGLHRMSEQDFQKGYRSDDFVKRVLSTGPLIYLGLKKAYGGMNGDSVQYDDAHLFARPDGQRIYIYKEHTKYIELFTAE